MPSTFDRIKRLLVERFDGREAVTRATALSDLGDGWDSLDAIELSMDIEDEFDVQIPDEEIETLRTIGDVVDLVDRLRATSDA